MRIDVVELVRVRLPLVTPFRTSRGVQPARDTLLIRVAGPDGEGWGEDVALTDPFYAPEYLDASVDVLRRHLVPALLRTDDVTGEGVGALLAGVRGWPMAKAACETAVLDAELRAAGVPLWRWLGGVRQRVPSGATVGILDDPAATATAAQAFLDEGYQRVKLKIAPGADVAPVGAVRAAVGPDALLQADANGAYTLGDADHLADLDPFDLVLIEQPLAGDGLSEHAELARRIRTPVCLDETLTSAEVTADALTLGACAVVNLKPGRVGGLLEARRVHDLCRSRGVPVWCGGMYESAVGRAAALALASLPGFTLPADLSASARYFRADVTEPFELRDGHLDVPAGPGIGVAPDPVRLRELDARRETIRRAPS